MAGERFYSKKDSLEELNDERKQLSTFRKIPDAKEIDPDSAFQIAVYGAAAWLRSVDHEDWDAIAEKAVELYLSGMTDIKDICTTLDVKPSVFEDHINVPKIKAFVDGEIAKRIYEMALNGNEKMLRLVAERRLGWGKSDTLKVEGEIKLRPILNMSLLTDKEEAQVRSGTPVAESIEAEFSRAEDDNKG